MPRPRILKSRIVRSSSILLAACVCLLQLACKGPEGPIGPQGDRGPGGSDGVSDRQIRFSWIGLNTGTADTSGTLANWPSSFLTNFNIGNYVGIDSVVLSANMGSSNSNTKCITELFDVTDSVAIPGSTLQTNTTDNVASSLWVYSGNLLHSFPGKEISLAIRIKTDRQGTPVTIYSAVLLLYRK